ncbi:MAG: type II secretion system ATPase GspE [Nitrospinota bacterium]
METLKDLSQRLKLQYTDELPSPEEAAELVTRVPISFAKKSSIVPMKVEGGKVMALTSHPLNHHAAEDLGRIFAMPVKLTVGPESLVEEFINLAYEISSGNAVDMLGEVDEPSLESIAQELSAPADLLDVDEEAPIVRLLNSLMQQAIKEKASDIHIEPFADSITVRMRVDGILYSILKPPLRIHPQIVSRVKIMASLDIAEKRLPQDGRISVKAAGREIDIRVSTIPTTFGERVVMRLLDKSRNLLMLDQIGMHADHLESTKKVLALSNGIVLVTGPTGSGKTTTLYAVLGRINTKEKNVITVEDPVEYQVKGIGQMQVNAAIGLTFASGLRSILRQDPDIIMVGEIRDKETAAIAVQASLTGHLVFSTLHTNDSASAVTRLVDIGIEPFLISSSLSAVMAQRLVRVLCTHCKKPEAPSKALKNAEMEKLARDMPLAQTPAKVFKAAGCPECMDSGYRGRTSIFEFLGVNDTVRSLIVKGVDANEIRQLAITGGMRTLRDDGLIKVAQGVTTLDEILRVTDENVQGDIS